MSWPSRWILGSFSLLFAWMFLKMARDAEHPAGVFILVIFCGLIAIACFSQIGRPAAIRAIGAAVALTYVVYVYVAFHSVYSHRLEMDWPDMILAVVGLLVYGIPGFYVAISGEYPQWGVGARGFRGKKKPEDKEEL